jgi:hypothetical protein
VKLEASILAAKKYGVDCNNGIFRIIELLNA